MNGLRDRATIVLLLGLLLMACSEDKTGDQSVQESAAVADSVRGGPVEAPDGEAIFNANCLPCHAAGPGHPGTMRLAVRLGEDKAVLTERSDLSADYVKVIVRQGILLMPPFRPSEITDSELNALASYLAAR